MIFLSFNFIGLASAPKKLAHKSLFFKYKPDIMMLQETLGQGDQVSNFLTSFLLGWSFVTSDVRGKSSGLTTGFKHCTIELNNSWIYDILIGVEVLSLELGSKITLVNAYGHFTERVFFLNTLLSKYYMTGPNMVVEGDFNFSLGRAKTWVPHDRVDPFVELFLIKLRGGSFIYSNLIKVTTT